MYFTGALQIEANLNVFPRITKSWPEVDPGVSAHGHTWSRLTSVREGVPWLNTGNRASGIVMFPG